MKRLEIHGLDITDLQGIIVDSVRKVLKEENPQTDKPSEFEDITLEKAAMELHCCKATIRRKMLELGIKGSKVGKAITIQRRDLKRLRRTP